MSKDEKEALQAGTQGQEHWVPLTNSKSSLDIILDVPLDVEVVLGSARKRIDEVRNLAPGAIVELDKLVDDQVDITVNGTLIAQGEVVVVNENFGVRITNILAPYERISRLRS